MTLSRRLPVFLESIKFAHSVFALPFALIAMLVAAGGVPGLWTLFWIVVACVAARTAAMTFNRLADREFDARNPRTANRALVSGELSSEFMVGMVAGASLLFVFSAAMLNRTCFLLSAPVLAVLFGYSLTKRFTDFSHLFLGLALGLAPLGAWIAVRETFALTPLMLSIAVMLWVAGFDILYSCQDYDVDREEEQLHSLPKRLGIAGSMTLAQKLHGMSLVFLFFFWWLSGLGVLTLLGILAIGGLLVSQHRLVRPDDLSRIDAAFFTTNGVISIGFFLVVLIDLFT